MNLSFIKIFISLLFLISVAEAQVTLKEVVGQLTNIHGAQWKEVIDKDEDKKEIKLLLKQIIEHKHDQNIKLYPQSLIEEVKLNAISEYGNFVNLDSKSQPDQEDKDFYLDLLSEHTGLSDYPVLSIIESLKSTGSIFAAHELTKIMSSNVDEALDLTLAHALVDLISRHENERNLIQKDSDGIDFYKPNLEKKFFERGNQEDWLGSINHFQKELESKAKNASGEQKAYLVSYQQQVLKLIKEGEQNNKKRAVVLKTESSHLDSTPKGRAPSSVEGKITENKKFEWNYIILIILVFISWLLLRKKI